jgi:peptidoglycan biosynthesis protein MviN/MurJ (putative lipid II flippase)
MVPALITVFATVSVAIFVKTGGVLAVTWIMCARSFATFLFLWALLKFPLPRALGDKNTYTIFKDVLALMSGSSIYKLGPLVDRYWASQATAGNLTIYNLAQSVMGAIASLLERAISLPAIPQLSRDISEAKYDAVGRKYKRTLLYIWSTILVGGLMGWLAFSSIQPSVASVFNLNMRQVQLLAMLSFALLGFLGVAASGGVINAMFYSMGDVKTPISIGIIGFFFGLLIKSLAFVNFGLVAMAIGTSTYYHATMIVMITIFERRLREKRS